MTDDGRTLDETRAVGERVRRARVASGLTQIQVSARSDVFRHTVSHLERGVRKGRPLVASAKVLAAVAQVVELTPEDLEGLGRKDAANELRKRVQVQRANALDADSVLVGLLLRKRKECADVGEYMAFCLKVSGDVAPSTSEGGGRPRN